MPSHEAFQAGAASLAPAMLIVNELGDSFREIRESFEEIKRTFDEMLSFVREWKHRTSVPPTSEDPASADAVADDSKETVSCAAIVPLEELVTSRKGTAIVAIGFPVLVDAADFPDWHPFICSHVLGDFVSEILQLRIYVVIRLRYRSLKMSRIKWHERIDWNLLSAFC